MITTKQQRDAIIEWSIECIGGHLNPLYHLAADCNELEQQRNEINEKLDDEMAVSAGLRKRLEDAERDRGEWFAKKVHDRDMDAALVRAERLDGLLREANQVLRSAYQIANRDGVNVNWIAFRKMTTEVLEKQQAALAEGGGK